jgi:hypothetical protein
VEPRAARAVLEGAKIVMSFREARVDEREAWVMAPAKEVRFVDKAVGRRARGGMRKLSITWTTPALKKGPAWVQQPPFHLS